MLINIVVQDYGKELLDIRNHCRKLKMENRIVDKGVRFQNYIIDLIIVSILYVIVSLITHLSGISNLIGFQALYFLYYFIMEYKYGQTIGKRFTKTIVRNKKGERMNTRELLTRTLFRIVGLDALSFLMGNNVGMHDWFSNTRVIKITSEKIAQKAMSA